MEEPSVDAAGDGFGYGVAGESLALAEPDFENSGFVLHEQPDGLTAELPLAREFGDAEVRLERGVGPRVAGADKRDAATRRTESVCFMSSQGS
jgi:hypothetical protein